MGMGGLLRTQHVCTYIYIHTYIHTYVCMYVYTYTYEYIHTYVYTVHTYTHTYIHTHTHTHTHTHKHTHLYRYMNLSIYLYRHDGPYTISARVYDVLKRDVGAHADMSLSRTLSKDSPLACTPGDHSCIPQHVPPPNERQWESSHELSKAIQDECPSLPETERVCMEGGGGGGGGGGGEGEGRGGGGEGAVCQGCSGRGTCLGGVCYCDQVQVKECVE